MEHGKGVCLPKIMEPLGPFIKPRQESLEIRKILSVFLAQNIRNPYGQLISATSLVVPPEGTQVRLIAPQLTGTRRSYLKALQAHITARDCYNKLATNVDEVAIKVKRQTQRELEKYEYHSTITCDDLLREQRRYRKIIILRDTLDLLAKKATAKPDYLGMKSILEEITPLPEVSATTVTQPLSIAEDETQALVLKLEKAVLRAQNAFESEKSLLAEAKEKFKTKTLLEDTDTRILALHRTRAELIDWLELQLASTSQANDPSEEWFEESPISPLDGRTLDTEQRLKHIQETYDEYLEARKSLLALMLERRGSALKIPPALQEQSATPILQSDETTKSTQEANLVLPYLTEHLIPAATAQASFLQHESHLSNSLINENKQTIRILEILAEESHLLSNHSQSTTNPPSQKEFPRSSSKSLHSKGTHKVSESRTITQARGWALAASAARSSQEETIRAPLEYGEKEVIVAKGILQDLQDMLGIAHDEEAEDLDPRTDVRDKDSSKTTLPQDSKRSKGFWAGLDGKLGIDDK